MKAEPWKHLPTRHWLLLQHFDCRCKSFSDGELLLNRHTASASASFAIQICLGLPSSWYSQTVSICLCQALCAVVVLKCLGPSVCRRQNCLHCCCCTSREPEGSRNMVQPSLLEQLLFDEKPQDPVWSHQYQK